jgi:prophage regulatory protein
MDREIEKTGRRILRAPAVEDRTQRSRVQCWRDIKAGKFPAPVQLGPNSVGWFEDEIDAWLAARPRRTYRASVSKELQPKVKAKTKAAERRAD